MGMIRFNPETRLKPGGALFGHKLKIGFIGSTKQFINNAQTLSYQQSEYVEGRFALATLDEAVPIGKSMQREGIEVIISRRATAQLLRESLAIPVLSVPFTAFDLLLNVKEAASLGRKVLLTTFPSRLENLEILEGIFDIELVTGVFQDSKSLENVIIWGKSQGCKVVIGAGNSMKFAQKQGMVGVEIHTSEEAIASTIEDAKSIARSRRDEQEKSLRYRAIIDSMSEGIIAVNKKGAITTVNRATKDLLNIIDGEAIGKHIAQYIPNTSILEVVGTQNQRLNQVEKINQDHFVISHIPITDGQEIVGGILTFKDISNVMKAENEVRRSFAKRLIAKYNLDDFIHRSWTIKELINKVRKFAATDLTVLITGETGTGKEILAQSIHNLGPHRKGPFVSINCAALPEQLLESELFGYEEGAFTGSRRGGKLGLFELAHNGTIFLDEIGATPLSVQAKLLRVLEEREVMRVGGDRLIPITVRVIASANQNLSHEVQAGRFREDLFFRLNVLAFHIPPLRDRIEDLPLLVNELVIKSSWRYRFPPIEIPSRYINMLKQLLWPGNVRQLVNFIEKMVILSEGEFNPQVFEKLYAELLDYSLIHEEAMGQARLSLLQMIRQKTRKDETEMIRRVLEEAQFSKTEAARKLGVSRTTLWRKLKTMG